MTELPPAQAANLGLGARKFRLRGAPDMSDRSCWTDTPAQKAQKQKDLVNIQNVLLYISVSNTRYSVLKLKILYTYVLILCLSYFSLRNQKDSENQRRKM